MRAIENIEMAVRHPELEDVNDLCRTGFELVDRGLEIVQRHIDSNTLARAGGLALLKAKHLAVGVYILILAGLGQEAGALLRAFLEALEAEVYLRTIPDSIRQFEEDRLPIAGTVAKRINSPFQALRKYLNENAAHFGFTFDSTRHLVSFQTNGGQVQGRFVYWFKFSPSMVRANLKPLNAFLAYLVVETCKLVDSVCGCPRDLAEAADTYLNQVKALYD